MSTSSTDTISIVTYVLGQKHDSRRRKEIIKSRVYAFMFVSHRYMMMQSVFFLGVAGSGGYRLRI